MANMNENKKKLAVMVDSSADVSAAEANEQNLHVVRMPLTIDGVHFTEEIDISTEELQEKMKKGAVVSTSQPIMGDVISLWEELLEEYEEVLYIALSSRLSGTYQTAVTAARAYNGRVEVVDDLCACAPIQVLASYAYAMSKDGYNAKEIKEKMQAETGMFAIIIPETLTYLKRGGRIRPAVAALGNLLKIIPILKVENGEIDVAGKVRTIRRAYTQGMETALDVENKDDYEWMMVKAGEVDYQGMKDAFEAALGHSVPVKEIHAVIMAHTGPGTLGFARVKKMNWEKKA